MPTTDREPGDSVGAMRTERYAEFSARVHERVIAGRSPISGTIEVTRRCPLACAHCYNNLPMADQAARRGELTCEEHRRLLDEVAGAGCLWLLYTGGEIFARRDFLDIYTYAKRKGFIITLFTNGTLVTEAVADHLRTWRPFSIEITLYGRTRETYERLTGVPGFYDRCLRGIRLLRERGLPLTLKTVAVTINKHEVRAMQRFAEEELGVEFRFDAMINPRIDCSRSPLAVRLTPEEVVELDLQDPRRSSEWTRFAERFKGPVHAPEHSDEVYHCGGGVNSFAIDPHGQMSLCVLSHVDTYDWRAGSFREGWERFLLAVRGKSITRRTKCTACEIKAMRGMCPANGELENGDPEAPVDFLCRVAHLRAGALGISVPPHGECEYCDGGAHYPDLMRSVAVFRDRPPGRAEASGSGGRLLPVVTEASSVATAGCGSGGGCSSCSLSAIHGLASRRGQL